MVIALGIAEGVRMRGRTLLVVIIEIDRARRTLQGISPLERDRATLEQRIEKLAARRREGSARLEDEFSAYLQIVSEMADSSFEGLDRVGSALKYDLESRRLEKMGETLPLVRRHTEQMKRGNGIDEGQVDFWRDEIDDSRQLRKDRLRRKGIPPSIYDYNPLFEDKHS